MKNKIVIILTISFMSLLLSSCNNSFVDARDGKKYRTVKIGKQTWMAENLNYKVEGRSYCWGGKSQNCDKYGRLYTWATAIDRTENECGAYKKECIIPSSNIQGVCPDGWHLPSVYEFQDLLIAVGKKKNIAGINLKSTSGWRERRDKDGNIKGCGKNTYDFNAVPTGIGYMDHKGTITESSSHGEDKAAMFWTSTMINNPSANVMSLSDFNDDATLPALDKNWLVSVRCIKNESD